MADAVRTAEVTQLAFLPVPRQRRCPRCGGALFFDGEDNVSACLACGNRLWPRTAPRRRRRFSRWRTGRLL